MGEYFFWGFYNERPVYQHASGLDFLYYHKNNVWGVGPKIGGNSAGLLNFGRLSCPTELITPWEFGTKLMNKQRQMDPQMRLVCLDNEWQQPNKTTQIQPPSLNPIVFEANVGPMLNNNQAKGDGLLKCGLSTKEAPHPWQAQIKVSKDGMSHHLCSGVILTEKHVLTSASCLLDNPMKHYVIVVGQNALDELDEWEEDFPVQSIYTNDLFEEATGAHDVALVKVKQRRGRYISFASNYVQPICLPSSSSRSNSLETTSASCEISGWGGWKEAAGVSLMGQSVTIDQDRCPDKDLICVVNPSASSQQDFTFDDGMPLSCRHNSRSYLTGLHAKNIDPCQNGCPMMKLLKISAYTDWINARLAL
jgi:hypothetical protein